MRMEHPHANSYNTKQTGLPTPGTFAPLEGGLLSTLGSFLQLRQQRQLGALRTPPNNPANAVLRCTLCMRWGLQFAANAV